MCYIGVPGLDWRVPSVLRRMMDSIPMFRRDDINLVYTIALSNTVKYVCICIHMYMYLR